MITNERHVRDASRVTRLYVYEQGRLSWGQSIRLPLTHSNEAPPDGSSSGASCNDFGEHGARRRFELDRSAASIRGDAAKETHT